MAALREQGLARDRLQAPQPTFGWAWAEGSVGEDVARCGRVIAIRSATAAEAGGPAPREGGILREAQL